MYASSIAELKKELVQLDQGELLDTCLRMARFKKDNKELLTYLLFMSKDEQAYVTLLCDQIDEYFADTPNMHRKTLRKVIRWMEKCLRFSGIKETGIQVRLYFCAALQASRTPYRRHRVMTNMFTGQLKKINKAVESLHVDIRCEYQSEIQQLEAQAK